MSKSCKTATIKVNPTSETATVQHDLEKLRLAKKREMKTTQSYNYSRMFYGSPKEKEDMKRDHRRALLKQCKDKEEGIKYTFENKVKESQQAVESDQRYLHTDHQQRGTRAEYLKQFRDQNKELMEQRSEERKRQRHEENRQERELLRRDPINWSKTLV